ncbi:YrdB family protein [Metabacillus bambusae]|uniref:YrdB family protein n=1 Tax=Metabacillus bambusae TaxID=2795218 RepID=A0ABS3N5Q6_9BACI|nr:YrdB family protein [Metabacillus bambusae]MBO1513384.1 YrdB family protein [Metabacillus bambusae]
MLLLKASNLGLRFVLELCALAALGYWGFKTGHGIFLKVILGIGTPLVAATLWGLFGSPAAPFKVGVPIRLLLEIVINGAAAFALYASGKPSLAGTFIVVVIINKVLMIVWEQ